MTVGHGQEAAIDVLRKVGVVTVRLEHAKGAFIGSEAGWLGLLLNGVHLTLSAESPEMAKHLHVLFVQQLAQLPLKFLVAAQVLDRQQC